MRHNAGCAVADTTTKVTFSLATSHADKPTWHRVAFYNDPALTKYVDENVVTGSLVMIRGHIFYNNFESAGKKLQFTEIIPSS